MAAKRILTKKERGEAPREAVIFPTKFNPYEPVTAESDGEMERRFSKPDPRFGDAVERRLQEQAKADYEARRQAAIAMEVAAGDAADRKDYDSRRQAAIAMEVAAGDADYRKQRDAAIAAEPEYVDDTQDMGAMQRANRRMADESNQAMYTQAARSQASKAQPTKMVNPLAKVQESLEAPNTIFGQPNSQLASFGSLSEMAQAPVSPSMEKPATPTADPALTQQLFKIATQSTFNPKATGDAKMMAKIENLLGEYGGKLPKGMTPTQFALQLYRRL